MAWSRSCFLTFLFLILLFFVVFNVSFFSWSKAFYLTFSLSSINSHRREHPHIASCQHTFSFPLSVRHSCSCPTSTGLLDWFICCCFLKEFRPKPIFSRMRNISKTNVSSFLHFRFSFQRSNDDNFALLVAFWHLLYHHRVYQSTLKSFTFTFINAISSVQRNFLVQGNISKDFKLNFKINNGFHRMIKMLQVEI